MRGYIPPKNSEEPIFVKKVVHILDMVQCMDCIQFTLFMDLRQQQLFLAQANKYPDIKVSLVSGYDGDSERKLAAVYPDYISFEQIKTPVVILRTEIHDKDVSHQDFLGAAMALKIDREYIGDIIKKENEAFIICHKHVANIITEELLSVKRSSVSFEVWEQPLNYEKQYSELRKITVASLRLDSIVAAALNKSRTEAVKLVKQGNVKVNQMDVQQADYEIFDDDIISIRYNGKFKIFCDGGKSRKDRIFVNIAKY